MITIYYECMAPHHTSQTTWRRTTIIAHGESGAEVQADAERQCKAIDGYDLMAVGLNNWRSAWEAAFGVDTRFQDSAFRDGDPAAREQGRPAIQWTWPSWIWPFKRDRA